MILLAPLWTTTLQQNCFVAHLVAGLTSEESKQSTMRKTASRYQLRSPVCTEGRKQYQRIGMHKQQFFSVHLFTIVACLCACLTDTDWSINVTP